MTAPDLQPRLSSVKITENAKGMPQTEVKCYDGVDEDEMQRLLNLAVLTFETARKRLAAGANA